MATGHNDAEGQLTRNVYTLIKTHRYFEAVDVLNEKLSLYPRSRTALSLIAFCYYHMQWFEAAAEQYEILQENFPDVDEYKLYYAHCLYKSGAYQDATKASFMLDQPSMTSKVLQLQAGIKFNEGDVAASKTLLEQCPQDDVNTSINMACIALKEENYQEACTMFQKALEVVGKQPDVCYNLALSYFRLQQEASAIKHLADIIETAIQAHPELCIGLGTEGIDSKSVGNTLQLHESSVIEAFNLKAAILWSGKNYTGARECLTDLPPRHDEELDPVTLHNSALTNMEAHPSEGFEKLQFLLQQDTCPPELFGNLLLLYCKYEYYDLAADVLAENSTLTYRLLSPFLYEFIDTLVTQQTSKEEAFRRYDDMATDLAEQLRRCTKKVQESRGNRDDETAKRAIQEYDECMEKYMPVLMHQAKIYWDDQNYPALEKIFRKSVDKCNDQEAWKLNVAHTLFMQDNKYKEAINFYEPIVKKHYDELLGVSAIVLANLCVSYIMTSHNEEAEELMRRIEKEEEQIAYDNPDRKLYHLCIVNLVIGTLYCAKGNYEFGISRVMKSLEPYNRKLGTDTWYYAKRCFLSLLESMAKQMVFLPDSVIQDVLIFFGHIESYGRNVQVVVEAPLVVEPLHEGRNTVTYEVRYLRRLFLTIAGY